MWIQPESRIYYFHAKQAPTFTYVFSNIIFLASYLSFLIIQYVSIGTITVIIFDMTTPLRILFSNNVANYNLIKPLKLLYFHGFCFDITSFICFVVWCGYFSGFRMQSSIKYYVPLKNMLMLRVCWPLWSWWTNNTNIDRLNKWGQTYIDAHP